MSENILIGNQVKQAGASMIEILIVSVMFMFVLVALASGMSYALKGTHVSDQQQSAVMILDDLAQKMLLNPNQSYLTTGLSGFSGSGTCTGVCTAEQRKNQDMLESKDKMASLLVSGEVTVVTDGSDGYVLTATWLDSISKTETLSHSIYISVERS